VAPSRPSRPPARSSPSGVIADSARSMPRRGALFGGDPVDVLDPAARVILDPSDRARPSAGYGQDHPEAAPSPEIRRRPPSKLIGGSRLGNKGLAPSAGADASRVTFRAAPTRRPRVDLGSIGAVMSPAEDRFVDPAVELERLGFTTIWLTGGSLSELSQVAAVARATGAARIATGIIPVDRFPSEDVAALYVELEREQPGRFVVGLGGAHGPNPLATLNAYLARLDRVPRDRRVMAALGPRMLELARDRSAGAFPVLVTPQYVGRARGIVDGATTLAVGQLVVLEAEPHRARERARCPDGNNRTATDAIRRNPVPRHRHPPEEARGHGFTEGWGQCLDQLVALMKTH
jgi:hypothetical protein